VLLASPTDDLRSAARRLRKGLAHAGVEVLDALPPPYEQREHAASVAEQAAAADLCVHLLGESPGERIEDADDELTYPCEQTRLALAHAKSQLVLLPEDLDPFGVADASYRQFLVQLQQRPEPRERLELVTTSVHQMLDEVVAKRARMVQARLRAARGEEMTALIDLHIRDVPLAADLVSYLPQHNVTPMMLPSADHAGSSPSSQISLFMDNLRRARLFIVFYGHVARGWVIHRLMEAQKLILEDGLPTHIGVYLAPPDKSQQELRFPPFFEVLDNRQRFAPETLDALLSKASGA
jgi:hypothetical protein